MAQQVEPAGRKPRTSLALKGRVIRLASAGAHSHHGPEPQGSTKEAADTTAVPTSRHSLHRAPRPDHEEIR